MNRVLKTFLLWLLIAALPIQGIAAVVKASCGARHHDISIVMMEVTGHHHAAGSSDHHHDAADADTAALDVEATGAATDDSASAPSVHKTSYCSACAACCVGAAGPPPSLSLMPALGKVEAAVAPPVISFTGYIPAGLERPPKTRFRLIVAEGV